MALRYLGQPRQPLARTRFLKTVTQSLGSWAPHIGYGGEHCLEAQTMSTNKMTKKYLIHTADADLYFKFGKLYRESALQEIFCKRLTAIQSEFFPGLVLKDEAGKLYQPYLVVQFKPMEELNVPANLHERECSQILEVDQRKGRGSGLGKPQPSGPRKILEHSRAARRWQPFPKTQLGG